MSLAHGSLIDLPGLSTGDSGNRLGPMTKWIRDNAELFRDKSILDLGSNAGHFPVVYAQCGAKEVLAVEGRKEFETAYYSDVAPVFPGPIMWVVADIRNFTVSGGWDVLSCLGLIYHVEDGWNHLKRLAEESGASILILDSQLWHVAGVAHESGNENTNCLRKDEMVPKPSAESVERWLAEQGWGYSRVLHNWQTNGDMRGMWCVRISTDLQGL